MGNFHSDEIEVIQDAAQEIPYLDSYTLDQLQQIFGFHELDLIFASDFTSEPMYDSTVLEEKYKIEPIPKGNYLFAFTSEFRKNIEHYKDKKLQGRVLDAIVEIAKSPESSKGDTIKPLSGALSGKWRYRIGKFRLIYELDNVKRTIYLIALLPRGEAYE